MCIRLTVGCYDKLDTIMYITFDEYQSDRIVYKTEFMIVFGPI